MQTYGILGIYFVLKRQRIGNVCLCKIAYCSKSYILPKQVTTLRITNLLWFMPLKTIKQSVLSNFQVCDQEIIGKRPKMCTLCTKPCLFDIFPRRTAGRETGKEHVSHSSRAPRASTGHVCSVPHTWLARRAVRLGHHRAHRNDVNGVCHSYKQVQQYLGNTSWSTLYMFECLMSTKSSKKLLYIIYF